MKMDMNRKNLALYLGLIPVLAIALLIAISRMTIHEIRITEPPLLLAILNTLFVFTVTCIVAYMAMRSYLTDGLLPVLMLGSGVLAFGTGSLVAGWVIEAYGPNASVTIHNVSALVASILHVAGASLALAGTPPEADIVRKRKILTAAYGGVVAFIALLSLATAAGLTPIFFVQGVGPTAVRQAILAAALVFFTISSAYMMSRFLHRRSPFLYWYSLSLALLAIGLAGIFLQLVVGGPIGWLARISQYLAGVYFLVSVISAHREAGSAGLKIDAAVAEVFRNPLRHWLDVAATVTDAILGFTDQGTILFWNDAAERLFGYSRAEAVGKSLEILLPDGRASAVSDLVNTQERVGDMKEAEFRRKDGSSFDAEVSALTQNTTAGKIVTLVIRDVTGRRLAEEALRDSGERFRLLSSTAERLLGADDPQVIVEDLCRDVMAYLDCQTFFNFLVDERAGRLRLNACAGIPKEEALALEFLDYGVAVCGCVAQGRSRIIAEDIFHTPDIRTDLVKSFGVQAYCCHPLIAQDRLIGTLSFGTKTRPHFTADEVELMRTVTAQVAVAMERKQAEESLKEHAAKLEEAYKELEGFSYSVSHDLHAPLRAIDGYTRLLLRKHGSEFDADSLDKFNGIRSNAHMMGQLIDDLLALSRLSRRQMTVRKLDMEDIIQEVWQELRSANPGRDMALKLNGVPSGHGDRALMKQVYAHLLANAVKFTKPRPAAYIEAGGHTDGNEDVYYVRDNGVGFEMEYYDKLFGVFQRLHQDEQFEGTGIGLATVQRAIQRHGGRVWAEGEVDKGATFYFSLPKLPQ